MGLWAVLNEKTRKIAQSVHFHLISGPILGGILLAMPLNSKAAGLYNIGAFWQVPSACTLSSTLGVYNGTSLTSYKNGTAQTTTTSAAPSTSTAEIRLGISNSPWNSFTGDIAIVQIYDRALSAAEVLQNCNAQRGRFGVTCP